MNKVAQKGKYFLMLGQCLPSLKQNASRIRVRKMVLDKNLNMVIFSYKSNFFVNIFQLNYLHSISEKIKYFMFMIQIRAANPVTLCS